MVIELIIAERTTSSYLSIQVSKIGETVKSVIQELKNG